MILQKQRWIAFLLCLALALGCLSVPMGPRSRAAEPTFEVSSSPSTLSEPGKVKLTFKVTNPDGSSSPMKDSKVLRSDGSTVVSLSATINNSDSKTYDATITKELLGKPLTYTLSYTKGGAAKKINQSITIGSASTQGEMSVTSEPQNANLTGSNKTTINYTVKNTGSAAITNIKVTDKDIAGSKNVGTVESLAAGASKNFSYEATVSRNSVSEPVATGTAGGKTITATGAKKTITVGGAELSAALTSDKTTTGEGPIAFTLKLSNSGKTPITGVNVSDAAGESLKSNVTVPAGGTVDVTFDRDFSAETEFYVTVKGKDGAGKEVSAESNKIKIGEGEDDLVDPANGVSLTLASDKDTLEKPAQIKLTMEIENLLKDQGYQDIVILDKATQKELQKIEKLDAGETKQMESEVDIRESTKFIYIVKATADDGTALTLESNTLEIKVGDGNRNENFLVFLIIFLVVLVILIIVVVALVVMSRKNKKKKAAAYSNQYKKQPGSEGIARDFEQEAPLSTFSMDQDTSPINIPDQSSDFQRMDYDTLEDEDRGYDPDVRPQRPSEQTRPLKKPFQTIDYDDFDPDKQ